jgi:hypothetical protein
MKRIAFALFTLLAATPSFADNLVSTSPKDPPPPGLAPKGAQGMKPQSFYSGYNYRYCSFVYTDGYTTTAYNTDGSTVYVTGTGLYADMLIRACRVPGAEYAIYMTDGVHWNKVYAW